MGETHWRLHVKVNIVLGLVITHSRRTDSPRPVSLLSSGKVG